MKRKTIMLMCLFTIFGLAFDTSADEADADVHDRYIEYIDNQWDLDEEYFIFIAAEGDLNGDQVNDFVLFNAAGDFETDTEMTIWTAYPLDILTVEDGSVISVAGDVFADNASVIYDPEAVNYSYKGYCAETHQMLVEKTWSEQNEEDIDGLSDIKSQYYALEISGDKIAMSEADDSSGADKWDDAMEFQFIRCAFTDQTDIKLLFNDYEWAFYDESDENTYSAWGGGGDESIDDWDEYDAEYEDIGDYDISVDELQKNCAEAAEQIEQCHTTVSVSLGGTLYNAITNSHNNPYGMHIPSVFNSISCINDNYEIDYRKEPFAFKVERELSSADSYDGKGDFDMNPAGNFTLYILEEEDGGKVYYSGQFSIGGFELNSSGWESASLDADKLESIKNHINAVYTAGCENTTAYLVNLLAIAGNYRMSEFITSLSQMKPMDPDELSTTTTKWEEITGSDSQQYDECFLSTSHIMEYAMEVFLGSFREMLGLEPRMVPEDYRKYMDLMNTEQISALTEKTKDLYLADSVSIFGPGSSDGTWYASSVSLDMEQFANMVFSVIQDTASEEDNPYLQGLKSLFTEEKYDVYYYYDKSYRPLEIMFCIDNTKNNQIYQEFANKVGSLIAASRGMGDEDIKESYITLDRWFGIIVNCQYDGDLDFTPPVNLLR